MRTAGVMDSTNLLVRTDHESNGRFAFNYDAVRVIPNRADGERPHELAVFMQATLCDLRVWARSLACAGNHRGGKMKEYYVYMMTNRSRVVLYTGVTSRLEHRAWEHKNHVVEGFTSKYKPIASFITSDFPILFRQSRAKKKSSPGGARRRMSWCGS